MTTDILQHHGVKGMRWGVIRKTNDSVTTKSARDKVEYAKKNLQKTKDLNDKETAYGMLPQNHKTLQKLKSDKVDLKYAKKDLSNSKILDKIQGMQKTPEHLKLEELYVKKGMSSGEATVAAYKNIRTKKALKIAAGVAITAATVYSGYKFSDKYMDKVIKSGTNLQNVADDSNMGVRDAFYSSKHLLDKIKYKGLYGSQIEAIKGEAFVKSIKAVSDIKQVSPNNAKKALQELFDTDPEFAKGFTEALNTNKVQQKLGDKFGKLAKKAQSDLLDKGKINNKAYDTFNTLLVDHSPKQQKLNDKFYEHLSKKGYNAIKDVNDNKYSGYNALNPIIAFNTKGKVEVESVRKLTSKELKGNAAVAYAAIAGKSLAIGAAGVSMAKASGNKLVDSLSTRKARKYIEENPETKMTFTEIKKKIEKDQL